MFLQFPRAFEFNERFLLALHEHSQSSTHPTFFFDSPAERFRLGSSGVNPLWDALLAVRRRAQGVAATGRRLRLTLLFCPRQPGVVEGYKNPVYDPDSTDEWFRARYHPQVGSAGGSRNASGWQREVPACCSGNASG